MPSKYLKQLALPLAVCLQLGTATAADNVAHQCLADLDDIASFMPINDAGASAELADHGAEIERAFQKARADAARTADNDACDAIIRTYLRAWRPGHLSVIPAQQAGAGVAGAAARPDANTGADPRAPQFKVLGKDTIMLVFPTFNDRYQPDVVKLLADHRAELESHKNWIIDVRANGGGSDSTYQPLLGWLIDGDYPSHTVEYFVTPANTKAQEEICAITGDPKQCWETLGPVVKSMKAAAPGTWVMKGDKRVRYERTEKNEPNKPARVAVLVDRRCGSSCEQFLLEARTSFRVKLVGRSSYGSLDISNLRPHALPSGRVLYYGTTRTTRVPDMTIDGVGIAPDLLLPKPADDAAREAEVRQVQRWLEGGSLGGI